MAIKEKIKRYKKELVLQKVSDYLEKHGFAKAKMADIATYCGISVGALYKLFASKEEMFYAYVDYQIALFEKRLLARLEPITDPKERIRTIIALKFETFEQKRAILTDTVAADPLFFAKLAANRPNTLHRLYDLLQSEIERLAQTTPLAIKDSRRAAYIFNAITYGYVEYWLNEACDLQAFVDEAFEIFIKGVT